MGRGGETQPQVIEYLNNSQLIADKGEIKESYHVLLPYLVKLKKVTMYCFHICIMQNLLLKPFR